MRNKPIIVDCVLPNPAKPFDEKYHYRNKKFFGLFVKNFLIKIRLSLDRMSQLLYNLCDNRCKMLRDYILNRIECKNLKVFSVADFIDLSTTGAVRKTLERMEGDGIIRRIIQGFYDKPKFNNKFMEFEAPNIDDLALGIANRYGWHICPSGSYALNILGLSTQIPSQYVYISDGPYRLYEIMGVRLMFKHSTNRQVSNFSTITMLVIQALKAIGRENLTQEYIKQLRNRLSKENKDIILQEGQRTSFWIYQIIKDICEA